MEEPVHVRVGESGHVLGEVLGLKLHVLVAFGGIKLVQLCGVHLLLGSDFNLFQMLKTGLVFCL